MRRVVDRGAIAAAWVGVGMAITIGVSFVLVIPIEPVVWYAALPAGLLVGYYANARAGRHDGPWPRIVANSLFAGVATGVTFAAFVLGIKALFFAADNGYRVPAHGGPIACTQGADCVYRRYLAEDPAAVRAAGVTDVSSFTDLYWREQTNAASMLVALATVGGVAGGAVFGATNTRRPASEAGEAGAEAV